MSDEAGRAPNDRERSVLERILSASFPGAAELRRQIGDARVTRNWGPDNSPSIDISVPATDNAAELPDGPVPVAAQVIDAGGAYLGELLLWVADGRMSALEYSWVTDEPPTHLPETAWIHLDA